MTMAHRLAESSRSKQRIENLSDLVFGLALSLGSIILVSGGVVQTPFQLVSNIVLFGFSFAIVIWIWSGYTRTMTVLPFENSWTFFLNIVLLFCVAIEPYLFYVLQSPCAIQSQCTLLDFASSVYAVNGGAMMFILAGFSYMVVREEGRNPSRFSSGFSSTRFRRLILAQEICGLIFLASALPPFWVETNIGSYHSFLRIEMWYAIFAVFFIVLRFRSRQR
jgi:uncharacterized membrane protein